MSNPKSCRQETLAHNDVAHVQRCSDCGGISIHLGPVTVRLDAASLEALWAVLGEAAAALYARRIAERSSAVHRGAA
ncbi:hypothetical protein [Sorangium sp. So ce861]|uniref:hypothetical protein n=1 Tax=Sorangium sp. So ce861 TaxID=3133323 RepID=UPI003F601855